MNSLDAKMFQFIVVVYEVYHHWTGLVYF